MCRCCHSDSLRRPRTRPTTGLCVTWYCLRLASLTVQGERQNGYVRIKVEPSAQIENGVFVETNNHYEATSDEPGCRRILDILYSEWPATFDESKNVMYLVGCSQVAEQGSIGTGITYAMLSNASETLPSLRLTKPHSQSSHETNEVNSPSIVADANEKPATLPIPFVDRSLTLPVPRISFRTLQAWEGVVVAMNDDTFTAALVDLSNRTPDEEAEVSFEEVTDDERELVRVGAVFLLSVGYSISEGGQRSRSAILRFRRLPVWTESHLVKARREAQKLTTEIRWQ